MILDIDIRISNDNGVQIQQFSKHFDSRFEGISGLGTTNNSISKGFDEFLAEFLSSSGRIIRNNLIAKPTVFSDAINYNQYPGDVEYTLKLGESGSVSGHIPLNKLFRLSELSKFTEQSYSSNVSEVEPQLSEPTQKQISSIEYSITPASLNGDDSLVYKRSNFKTPVSLSEVDEIFRQFITTAVTRYEDSFYVEDIIDSNFAESS
jgi:hypothetical protein